MQFIKDRKKFDTQTATAIYNGPFDLFKPYPARGKIYKTKNSQFFMTTILSVMGQEETQEAHEVFYTMDLDKMVSFLDACRADLATYTAIGVELSDA